jgi:hypothetical protein
VLLVVGLGLLLVLLVVLEAVLKGVVLEALFEGAVLGANDSEEELEGKIGVVDE